MTARGARVPLSVIDRLRGQATALAVVTVLYDMQSGTSGGVRIV